MCVNNKQLSQLYKKKTIKPNIRITNIMITNIIDYVGLL